MNNKKTRNLSVVEYFLAIQKEYLIAQFKKKIYFTSNDKAYYHRVMNHKIEKIRTIGDRNHLNSILNNRDKMEEIRSELFDKSGRPKFEMSDTDLENYYAVGNDFSYLGEIWVLDKLNEDGTLTLCLEKTNERKIVQKDEVCRIL